MLHLSINYKETTGPINNDLKRWENLNLKLFSKFFAKTKFCILKIQISKTRFDL